jgi:DNA-binding response OmpR family regulator
MDSANLAGCSVLVVEDEPLIALGIKRCFEEAGAKVVVMRSLRDALVAVEEVTLSAAILDHALGDGDSSRLYKRLEQRDIPFVLHSGYSEPDERISGHGVMVPKPASPQLLVTTIEGLLRGRPFSH